MEPVPPIPMNATAAAKLWAVALLRRLADELDNADRRVLPDALQRLRLQELAQDAVKLFPNLADLTRAVSR